MGTLPLLLLLAAGPLIPFVENDYPAALAQARARNVPLFVDGWAPWCHTCLSMRETVFKDPALAVAADRFVFLSLDTDRPSSAAFLDRHPMNVWPTFFVIDPKSQEAVLRWPGSGTAAQMLALLHDGELAQKGGTSGAEALLARADRLYGQGDSRGAAAALTEALARAGPDWPRRGRAAETLVMALGFGARDFPICAGTALDELGKLPRSSSWANVAGVGLYCALQVKQTPGYRQEVVFPLEERVRRALGPPAIDMAPDDRSGLYEELCDAREQAGDQAGKVAVAEAWLSYLEGAAARAGSTSERAVYDAHRMSAALEAGKPERALAPLLASERDFPGDYNPPARLALVYLKLGRLDQALGESDRALSLVYGPRKARVLNERGDILKARGDLAGARAAWTEVEKLVDGLPAAQRPTHDRDRAARSLTELTSRG